MHITQVAFAGSSVAPPGRAHQESPACALIGRSNVGKSSLINLLLERKGLARTSSTPGKTRWINRFLVNNAWYLVDLPGYGWARVSKTQRDRFQAVIAQYLRNTRQLRQVLLLIDGRLPPQAVDVRFAQWLVRQELPFTVVFTKADGCKPRHLAAHVEAFRQELGRMVHPLPPYFITSARKRRGAEALRSHLARFLGGAA